MDFYKIAHYYDAMYVDPDAYRQEVRFACSLITRYQDTNGYALLDLACGTGEQCSYFSECFAVTGLDLSAEMLKCARAKFPNLRFVQGNMFDFSFPAPFDAIANLYGSVGFADGKEQLAQGIACAYRHLKPGGVFLLTPWSTKETFEEKLVTDARTSGDISFCRMESVRRIADDKVRIEMHHLIGNGLSIEEHSGEQLITLFSEADYRDALEQAGFTIRERLTEEQFRMGAFVCTKEKTKEETTE